MNTTLILAASFVLFLVALPLISFGAMDENEVLWWAGLALLAIAGILPPATRFIGGDDKDDKEAKGDGEKDEATRKRNERGDAAAGDHSAGRQRYAPTREPGTTRPAAPAVAPEHPRATEPPPAGAPGDREPPRAAEQRERSDELVSGKDRSDDTDTGKENRG
jgi:hypothetical protein